MAKRHGHTTAETAISSRMVGFLEKLPAGKQSASVMRLMDRMGDSDLEQLTASARVSMMRAVWQKNSNIKDPKRVSATGRLLHTQTRISPALAEDEAKGWTEFTEKVMTRLPLDQWKRDWKHMNRDDKVEAMQGVAMLHSEAFELPEAKVSHKAFKKEANGFRKTAEYFADRVNINLEDGLAADSFKQALTYTAHELTHHWQHCMAEMKDNHPKNSDAWAQSEMFRMSFMPIYYQEGKKDVSAYRGQLIEQHAFGRQADLTRALTRREQSMTLRVAPQGPAMDAQNLSQPEKS